MLALYVYTPLSFADVLVAGGKNEEAKRYFDAAIQLAPDADFARGLKLYAATKLGDVKAISDPAAPISPQVRAALLNGYRAARSNDPRARGAAVEALLALPQDEQDVPVARLLADLGADRSAFDVASRIAGRNFPGPIIFWYPNMRKTLDDPRFPALAQQLGLASYWKKSHTRPDVCSGTVRPQFCSLVD